MRVLCNNCGLRCHIKGWKGRLDDLLIKKQNNLLDDEVICLSRSIDNLISDCIFCNTSNLYRSNRRDTGEKDSILYYYGEQHLIVNLYNYIEEGIRNKENIYISVDKNLYKKLENHLIINRIAMEKFKFACLKDMKFVIENKGESIKIEEEKSRWIVQPSLQKHFLYAESTLNKHTKDLDLDILYIYDAYEYIHRNIKSELSFKLLEKGQYSLKRESHELWI
ncbi:hypothetical protein [Clostridium beijerinckii]|uniref:hypothetical protein n=1 Tax=Clostridium beijerinckii TaxID=1520 RepID=UPI00047AAF32|nr:hypothetical protein [Clostridium beijerinckii]